MPGRFQLGKPWTVRSQFSLNYKHVFSMEFLYKRVHEWLIEEGYTTDGDDKWIEKLYLERVAGNDMKQIWIWWRMDKTPVQGNNFFKFILNVDFHALGLSKEDIVVDGTKISTNKGEIEVFITAKMILDPDKEWDKNFFLKSKMLQDFYLNRIYKERIEQVEDELAKDCARLLSAVKQYFQLESWMPEYSGKPFHPAKGE